MTKCAFDRECECSALNVKLCEGCSFFKTKEELIAGREKAPKRVNDLPRGQRAHIYDKYYAKSMRKLEKGG